LIPDAGRSTANTKQEVAERLEKALDEQIMRPTNITVHIEPDTPEMRNRK
jgi:flagellar biosynthesis/type III secretory pathway protein FliH